MDHRRARRRVLAWLVLPLAATCLLLGAGSAQAASTPDEIAAALTASPVYVEDGNEAGLTQDDAARILEAVGNAGTPVYVAVVPEASLGGESIATVNRQIGTAVGEEATYVLVAGRQFRADSRVFDVSTLADDSVAENKAGGANAIIDAFVAGVADLATGGSGATPGQGGLDPGFDGGSGADPGLGSSTGGSALPLILAIGGLAVAGVAVARLVSRSSGRTRRATPEEIAAVRTVVDEDVTEFGEQVTAVDATDVRLGDPGRADLTTALSAYDTAKARAEVIRSPEDAQAVTTALEDGRFALACVQARLAGTALPVRRPPCFMDPRHGPSTQDVMWAPEGGTPRSVPVCQACAVEIADGRTPAAREVPVGAGSARVPYWQAGPQYGGYAGGYYSSFGNVLPAFLLGTMLGDAHGTVYAPQQDLGWMGGGGSGADSGGWMGGGGGGFDGGGGGGGFDGGGGGGGFDGGGGGGF